MKRTIFIVIFGSLLAVSVFAQTNLQTAAIVNLIRSEPITVGQVRTEVERIQQGTGRQLTHAERVQVLDVMINERLAIQAAERDRISITDNELSQQIQQLRSSLAQQIGRQPTDAEFNQAIREQSGLDINAFREQLRKQMITQKYLLAKKEDWINSTMRTRMPTETDIVNEFDLSRTQFFRPQTVRISMIQIPYGADAASRMRARELADSLLREIGSNPSRFDEVAARSAAPNSGYQAGDAGFLPRTQEARNSVGQDFINVAFNLRQGEISRLIEGTEAFQIIKVTENYTQKNLELDDIFPLGTRTTVRDYIREAMLNQIQNMVLAQASQDLVTELRAGRTFQIFENTLNW